MIPYDDRPDLYDRDPRTLPDWPLANDGLPGSATDEGTEIAYYEDCEELAVLRIWARRCVIPGCKTGRLQAGTLTCGDESCMQELAMWPDTLRGYLQEYRAHHPGRAEARPGVKLLEAALALFGVALLGVAAGVLLAVAGSGRAGLFFAS